MKRRRAIASAILLLPAAGWFLYRTVRQPEATPPAPPLFSMPSTPPAAPLVGESLLQNYARPDRSVRDDLKAMSQLLTNFQLLVKHPDALPLGGNGEIAAALRGQGRHNREPFLPVGHRSFNAAGDLIDRWGTPLFFHAEARDRISIRTAGPDRALWTADDLTLGSDRAFREGAGN